MANVLIADDSIIMRKNLRTIITKAGHKVVGEAVNGQQAFLLYNKKETDIVTLDITMPVMDGIEALKRILTKDPEAKVIIISALDQKRMVFQALECGAKYYIIKPVTGEKVINAIDKVLSMGPIKIGERINAEELKEFNEPVETIKQDQKVSEEVTAPQPPFTIDNENGTFIININNIDLANINILNSAILGFLFVKPLKITLKFNSSSDYADEVVKVLILICKRIREAGGELSVDGPETLRKRLV